MEAEELVAGHIELAKRQAALFCRQHDAMHLADEMESAALLGLARACRVALRTAQFSSFAYACIRNEMLQVIRTISRQEKLDTNEMYRENGVTVHRIGHEVDLSTAGVNVEARVDAARLLADLPEEERNLLRLRYFEDQPFGIVGQILGGLHKTTALQRHQGVIEKLQKRMRRHTAQGWKKAA